MSRDERLGDPRDGIAGAFLFSFAVVQRGLMKYLDDGLLVAGAVLICVGVYFVAPVATWFVAGAFCIAGGVLVARGGGEK